MQRNSSLKPITLSLSKGRRSRRVGTLCALLLSVTAWGETLTDPTRPPLATSESRVAASTPATPAAPFKLEGILRQGTRLVAIVDGQVVRAGSWIGDARIDAVAIDEVRYTRAGQSRIVRFETAPIRVRRAVTSREDERS